MKLGEGSTNYELIIEDGKHLHLTSGHRRNKIESYVMLNLTG